MAIRRRLQIVISCFLTVLLVGGTALPAPALWQCHHSTQVVNAAFTASPSAMPCRIGVQMATMACCLPEKATANQKSSTTSFLSRPACQPTLSRMAAISIGSTTETHAHLRRSLSAMQAAFPLPVTLQPYVPITLSVRQRPPPTIALSQSSLEHTPSLRAPPIA